ncbi:MAG TPA: TolC family protein [Chthonomonadaceae bacterium]|nr:TolC family protein [Chthonomonadaceae bacterium]
MTTVAKSGRAWLLAALALLPIHSEAQTLSDELPKVEGPLTLAQAVQIGLRENLMIRAAQSEAQAAAAETRAARSLTRVQVSANTYLTYGDSPNIVTTSPGVMPPNALTVMPQGFADQNLMLMVPLYTGGRLNSLARAAAERERAAAEEVGGVQAETALQIKEAYYRALLAAEIVKAAQARVEADTALLQTTRAQFEAGKGIEASVRRVEAEQADAQRALTSARNDQAKALLDLKAAMGVRLDSALTVSDALAFQPPGGDLASALKAASDNRPELRAARLRVHAAGAQTSAAKSAYQPQVYGTAMADGFSGRNDSGVGYTVGLTLSIPLVDGGQRRAEVAQARAMQERAAAESRSLELTVAKEVRQAWLDVETAAQNYRTTQMALQAAQAAYEVIALRVQNQKSILVEQLDALAALTQARANLAQALYDHATAVARLQRATGRL